MKSIIKRVLTTLMVTGASMSLLVSGLPLPTVEVPVTPIETTSGLVAGKVLPSGVNAWFGVPYAQAPVRDLRWKAPQPINWSGVYNADRFAPACFQDLRGSNINHYFGNEAISEDCLYLNIWAPSDAAAGERPVIVWIYGGGLTVGSAAMRNYSGEHLAAKGAVYVSMNYRVGILGFLAHPELRAESPDGASGNYGMLDQVAALKWVHDNIAAFGGDPKKVTIAGESAGSAADVGQQPAMLVSAHLREPIAWPAQMGRPWFAQVVGGGLGAAVALGLRASRRGVAPLAALAILGGMALASAAGVELLLTLVVAGFVAGNLSRRDIELRRVLGRFAAPIFVLFFALAGAGIDLAQVLPLLPLVLPLAAIRAGAIWTGTALGVRWAGTDPATGRLVWMGLVSQAGLAIGLVAVVAEGHAGVGGNLANLVLPLVAVNVVVGPILFRRALVRGGEVRPAGAQARPAVHLEEVLEPTPAVASNG